MKRKEKPRNKEFYAAMVEVKRSNATTPIRSKKAYTRKSKYGKKDW